MTYQNSNRKHQTTVLMVAVLVLFGVSATSGFIAPSSPSTKLPPVKKRTDQRGSVHSNGSSRFLYHGDVIGSSSLMVSAESWRQYVPLVVSVGIIIDILLGNPLANSVLKPMRPEGDDDSKGGDDDKKNDGKPSKARIDAELVAQQALDRANNMVELKNFLEERKTDYDRMEELKRKLDASMQDLDEDMEARQKEIDERRT